VKILFQLTLVFLVLFVLMSFAYNYMKNRVGDVDPQLQPNEVTISNLSDFFDMSQSYILDNWIPEKWKMYAQNYWGLNLS
jgi:hypothetical protein